MGPLAKPKHITCTHQDFTSTYNINEYLNHICGLGMPWPWDDVTVQLNDAYWRTSTSFHLLSTNTSRKQCAPMSHPFSSHKGLLRPSGYAYGRFLESLPKPTIWDCMDYAKMQTEERRFLIQRVGSHFQDSKIATFVWWSMALNASVLWSPAHQRCLGYMGHQLGGIGWTKETQENLRKSPENDRKSTSNPLSAWIPAKSQQLCLLCLNHCSVRSTIGRDLGKDMQDVFNKNGVGRLAIVKDVWNL